MKVLLWLSLFSLASCFNSGDKAQTKISKGAEHTGAQREVKNVILMIGDGMGPGQISLLHHFINNVKQMKNIDKKSLLQAFGEEDLVNGFERLSNLSPVGISATEPYGNIVVDSACSASQLALGEASRPEMIGLDKDGNPVDSILIKAKKKGLSTGLVSDTRITHATPASFAANVSNRWLEDDIAKGMLESAPDIMFSGGSSRFIPKGQKRFLGGEEVVSRRNDELDLLSMAKDMGYQFAFERRDLDKLSRNKKVLGLFSGHNFPDSIWFKENALKSERKIPTLLEMSKAAIGHLAKNEKGFFLMIEGGQIDWASHQNDAGTLLHEMLTFNKTLNWIIDWVSENPDTLLVVTADHETGSFGLGYNTAEMPKAQKLEGKAFKDKDYQPIFNYGRAQSLERLYQQKKSFNVVWKKFLSLKEKNQGTKESAKELAKMMEEATGLSVTEKQAQRVLEDGPNPHQVDWHWALKKKTLPKVDFNREYYYDPVNTRLALMGQAFAGRQNVVWGTGGHTATGVHVYTMGPEKALEKFRGPLNHPLLGKLLQKAIGL